jgi:hypothetical protein
VIGRGAVWICAAGGGAGSCGGFGSVISPEGTAPISEASAVPCASKSDRSPPERPATKAPPSIKCGIRTAPVPVGSCRGAGMLIMPSAGGGSRRSPPELTALCVDGATRCVGSFHPAAELAMMEAILL